MATRHRLGAVTALAALSGPAQAAPTGEERAVLAPLLTRLDGLKLHDKKMMQFALTPEGSARLLRDGKLEQLKLSVFFDRIPFGTDKDEEPLYDPLVKIDDNIATIWAPYDFSIRLARRPPSSCGMGRSRAHGRTHAQAGFLAILASTAMQHPPPFDCGIHATPTGSFTL